MFEPVLLTLSALILACWLASGLEMIVNGRTIPALAEIPTASPESLPSVTVIVAARNEAATIEPALESLLSMAYPSLDIVVVNDRSTDRTGTIMERAAARSERLRVVHIESLPAGWLGKNHAMAAGAAAARGEWLLFTDADVHFQPHALTHAVSHAVRQRLDHLAVAPRILTKGILLNLFAGAFALLFAQVIRPWRARNPRSRFHIGIGAFNLVRAEVYRAVGGHEPIRMRPDDDLRLGRLLKEHGYRQDLAFGRGDVSVEWYASISEATRGLEKNSFAAVDYSLPVAMLYGTLFLLMGIYPFTALLFTSGVTLVISALTCVWVIFLYAGSTRTSGAGMLLSLAFPLAALLVFLIIGRATALTVWNDGISWRGTHYPLAELKKRDF